MGILLLTAVCAYGYKVTNVTIGIDDTPSLYYFEEGLIAIVGRWVLFLLNKVISLAEFAPFVTDFAAVLLLIAAAIVWSALFYSVFGEKIPMTGYAYFAAVFVSCPLISEVFTYFLHNGIAIGYLSCAVSLCCMREWQLSIRKQRKGSGLREKPDCPAVTKLAAAAVFLWIAMGCYESFMILRLAGLVLLLLAERIGMETVHCSGRTKKSEKSRPENSTVKHCGMEAGIFAVLAAGAAAALLAILLRSLMIVVVTKVFHLEYLQGEAVQRSVTEMLGWMEQTGAFGELIMILKRTFVLYGVFAYAYPDFCVIGGCNYSGYPGAGDPRQRPVGPDPPADGLSGGIFAVIYRRKSNALPFGTISAGFLRIRSAAFCLCGMEGDSMVGTEDTEVSK